MESYGFIQVMPMYVAHFDEHFDKGAEVEFEQREIGPVTYFTAKQKYFVSPRKEESPQPLIHRMPGVDVYLGEDIETGTFIGRTEQPFFKGDVIKLYLETGEKVYVSLGFKEIIKEIDDGKYKGKYASIVMFVREATGEEGW